VSFYEKALNALLLSAQTIVKEEIPLAYLPGGVSRVRIRVVGDLAGETQQAAFGAQMASGNFSDPDASSRHGFSGEHEHGAASSRKHQQQRRFRQLSVTEAKAGKNGDGQMRQAPATENTVEAPHALEEDLQQEKQPQVFANYNSRACMHACTLCLGPLHTISQ
jgi:hypothetical protein